MLLRWNSFGVWGLQLAGKKNYPVLRKALIAVDEEADDDASIINVEIVETDRNLHLPKNREGVQHICTGHGLVYMMASKKESGYPETSSLFVVVDDSI